MTPKRSSVGIGIVGMGFMGLTHLRAARKLRGGGPRAIVTSDPRKARGDFSSVGGNFGAGGGQEDLSDLKVYPTLDDLLTDDGVRLVDLCLPSHLHFKAAKQCLAAGKAVLVEKPIALTPTDARRMIDASRKSGQILMVAQVLKFLPEFTLLWEAIEDQRWGPLKALDLRRIIARPNWSADSWLGDPARSGGMVIDLHIHDTDFVVSRFGRPRAVTSGGVVSGQVVDFLRTTYHYGKGKPLVTSSGGWINAPKLAFEHGYSAFFSDATLVFNSTHCPRPRLFTAKSDRFLTVKALDGFRNELQAAVDSVRAGKPSPLLAATSAATSLAVCLAEQKSARTGRRVDL